jgi:6-pyruvoyltetrahydropterin/6-carboxytetrahydropterin synthase
MGFEISTTHRFSAAHQLRLYDGTMEPLHGHNWRVRVTVQSDKLDKIGVVMDFHELQRLVDDIIKPMHNRHLSDLPAFGQVNATAERVAVQVAREIVPKLKEPVRLVSVEVWETDDCRAVYRPRGEAPEFD